MEFKMDKKLESRIARLENLLSYNKSVKNEDRVSESNKLADRAAKALKRALDAMQNHLDFEEAHSEGRRPAFLNDMQHDIDVVTDIYESYL